VRHLKSVLTVALAVLLMAIPAIGVAAQDATPAADNSEVEIAYVLHGINAFTERIQTGAEDAARDSGVSLDRVL
jgi:ABC-type sugar transport system substrate-binding protein